MEEDDGACDGWIRSADMADLRLENDKNRERKTTSLEVKARRFRGETRGERNQDTKL